MTHGGDRLRRLQSGASTAALAMVLALSAGSALAQEAQPTAPGGAPAGTRLPDGAQQTTSPVADGPQPGGTTPSDAGTVSEVVVTGFRAAIESAIAVKRAEAGVVDAIKAEDIAKFPDNNLAESLQRIPGVAITRAGGEGRNITVRGLGPGSTRVRINGMEALASTGGSDADGGANRARQFDFNVFASELFNSLAVRKTPSASVEEGSLGATVDLQTSRAFDFRQDQSLVLSAQAGYNDLSKSWDPRFAVLASKKFLDDTVGVLVSVAHSKRNVREEGWDTVRWGEGTSNGGWCSPLGFDTNAATAGQQFNPGANAAVGATAANCAAGEPRLPGTPENIATYQRASDPGSWHPRIPRYLRFDYETERLGITGSLQWKPTSRTLINFDYLYADYKSDRRESFLEGISFSRGAASPEFGKPYMIPRVFETDANGTLTYGVFDNVDIRVEAREDELRTIFTQYTLSGTHELTDNIKISGLIGTSKSSFKNPIQTTITLDRANQDNWVFDARDNPKMPSIGWGFDVNDPNAFTFTNANTTGTVRPSEIRLRPQFVQNSFDQVVGDIEWRINDTFTLRTGAVWKKYVNDGQEYRRQTEFAVPALPAGASITSITEQLTGFGKGLDADLPDGWVVPNFDAIASALNIYSNQGTFALFGIENTNARGNFRTITEESRAGYVQLDFDTDVLPWRIRGDVGVRYVDTDTTAEGYTFAAGAPLQLTVENSYDNWLPAANVVVEVTPDILIRGAAAKVMVRPGLGALNPGGTVNTTGNLSVSTGNPRLMPQEANTYDLSFEWYPTRNSLIALGLFRKEITQDFSSVRLTGPFSSFGLDPALLAGSGRTPSDETSFSTTINAPGGEPYEGAELNIQMPFTFLRDNFGMPEWTGNFGGLFNYTYVTGTQISCGATPVNGVCSIPLESRRQNVSKGSYNVTLFYEDEKLSARVSGSYRGDYLTAIPSANQGNLTSTRRQDYQDADWVPATFMVDASLSYQLTEKLKVSLEGINLTDEEAMQYNDTVAERVWNNRHFGRQYYVGLRYTF
ncbi:TonB-dependent receptor [Phenylobacterium deserti]|nr:TonB-dependent receptor [Phenylobacterium deserti]